MIYLSNCFYHIPSIVVFPYLVFAFRLQIILNKYAKRFNVIYLIIYIFFSFISVFFVLYI
ncbi:hypothetical protein EKO25_24485 [Bacillus sp. SAJ1]|nr:hypothetical protein EKO25_24485 [Bacillus sp. SAJ1]